MNTNAFPTKGNLMLAKNSLTLAKQGYELMDKKRNILIRELMNLIEEANLTQQYSKITANASTEFKGETCNFYGLLKAMQSTDRQMQKEAMTAWGDLYE